MYYRSFTQRRGDLLFDIDAKDDACTRETIDGMKRLADPDVVASSLYKGERAQGAKERPAMEYGAIDLHAKHSQVRIVTAHGTVVVERRIATRADQFAAVFGGCDRMRILLESSTESGWVATCLEGLGHEVVVADPNFAAMYGPSNPGTKDTVRSLAQKRRHFT